MRILAIDAATRTGWALGVDGLVVAFGCIALAEGLGKNPSRGAKLARARLSYGALMRDLRPDTVLLECPFARGVATTRLLYGLAAVAEGLAHEHGAAFLDLEPSAVRRRILGKGNPPDAKAAVLAWCRAQGHDLEDYMDDEADALLLLEVGFRDVFAQAPARRKKAA